MNKIFKPVFKNILTRKSTLIMLGISVFPLIMLITSKVNADFMQLYGESLPFISILEAMIGTQQMMAITTIIMAYIASMAFYEEINFGKMYFYKDINRDEIFKAKYKSILMVYFIFIILLIITSGITYYLFYLDGMTQISGKLFERSLVENTEIIISILSLIFSDIICITVAVMLSTKLSTGYTILGTLFFYLVMGMAPMLKTFSYLFPRGYIEKMGKLGVMKVGIIILAIFFIHNSIAYIIGRKKFKELEY